MSVGVAFIPDDASDSSTLLRIADRLLCSAKASGRNRVVIAPAQAESGGPVVALVDGQARGGTAAT